MQRHKLEDTRKKNRNCVRAVPLISLALLLVAIIRPTHASADCESNFKAEGNERDGVRFNTTQAYTSLHTRSALHQMQKIAKREGFEACTIKDKDTQGSLIILRKATPKARAFTMQISADEANNTVSMATRLPPTMQADQQAMRQLMCRMLGQVKPGDVDADESTKMSSPCEQNLADANDAASTIPPIPLFSSISASINDTCSANFSSTYDTEVGRRFTTWVVVDDLDPRSTISQFKQAARMASFDIGQENYRGSEGSLAISLKSAGSAQSFPLRIEVDRALGTISIAARANPNQEVPYDGTKQMICSMIAMATGSPLPKPETKKKVGLLEVLANPSKKTKDAFEKDLQKVRQQRSDALDTLYRRAVESHKAIVFIPSFNMDAKYQPNEVQQRHAEYWADQTSTTIWQGVDDHKETFKVGYDASSENIGLHGYVYAFDAGHTAYFMYIVNPGTHTITGNTVEAERTTLPDANGTHASVSPRLGQVTMAQTKKTEFYQTQEWFDAVYADRTIRNDYCTLTIVGGPCVQWNSSSSTVQDEIRQEGYRTVTKSKLVDGLVIASKLTREFASFKVAPGEVVLVDGFFAQHPNTDFDNKACTQQGINAIECDMLDYFLVRIPAKLSDLKSATLQAAMRDIPSLKEITSMAKYRETKVAADAGNFVNGFGQEYHFKKQH